MRNRFYQATILLCSVLAAAHPARSQDEPEHGRILQPLSSNGTTVSPFEPPSQDDRHFVTNSGPLLDTDCLFRNEGPIIFEIEVTRHVGELNSEGTLRYAPQLVEQGYLSATATLEMPVWDVDSLARVTDGLPEFDEVYFNDHHIGTLSGNNNIWTKGSFEIPIEWVKFAEKGPVGSDPTPGINQVRIDIDIANAKKLWCTAVDWGSLDFKSVSPILLVHGNGSDSGFFDRQGLAGQMKEAGLPVEGCGTCGSPIDLPAASTQANGFALAVQIPALVKSLGVDSIHLVAHSKGGLDARQYLAQHHRASADQFEVLSLTTLSTPHDGSLGADILLLRRDFSQIADRILWENFPFLTNTLATLFGVNGGTPYLTTWYAAAFNFQNLGSLPTKVTYHTLGADADRNGSGSIDSWEEYAAMGEEEWILQWLPTATGSALINQAYQALRSIQSIDYEYSCRTVYTPGPDQIPLREKECIAKLIGVPSPHPIKNDVMVTIGSAHGAGGFGSLAIPLSSYDGPNGRNHASIADAAVASTVTQWILWVEEQQGDLKP